jgi:hypothetical protein
MSGELVLSQFRYTTTNNRDFVIGDPTDSNLDQPKYLVFQVTNQSGYNNNPHIKAEKISGNWRLSLSQNGSTTLNFAYADSANTFTASNIFQNTTTFQNTTSFTGAIIAGTASFSDNVTVGGNLVVNGSTTYLNVANVTVTDKNITLNKGGLADTGNGAGISIEEGGSSTGYLQVSTDRAGWDLKAPGTSGIATFITNGTYSYTLPARTGTLALTSDTPNISNMVTTDTVQSITGTKTFTTVNATTVNATTFNGNLTGSLDGLTLPGAGLDGQMLTKEGSSLVWTTPIVVGTDTNAVHLTGDDIIHGVKDFRTKIALGTVVGTYQGSNDYSSYIEFTKTVVGVPASGNTTKYDGNYLFSTSDSNSSSNFVIALGLNSIEQSDASVAAVITRASNKLSLELTTTESAGSSIILKDRQTGTRYEVYVNSGVLTVGLA